MWVLPSYGRPAKLQRFFDLYEKTKANSDGIVVLDIDDPSIGQYIKIKLPKEWHFHFKHERMPVAQINNHIFDLYPNKPWYGLLSDDAVPVTDYWDKELINAAGSDKIAHANDGTRDGSVPSFTVIGGELVRNLGHIFLRDIKHFYADDYLAEIGRRRGNIVYLKDVSVEHWHFTNGKAEYDDTYLRRDGSGDQQVFNSWLATQTQKQHIIFVCVNAGNYLGRGVEYVNKLHNMVRKNVILKNRFSFQVFTDQDGDYHQSIEVRRLPGDLQGWWNKLYLFKKELFDENARIIFLDLDTVIVGNIDHLFYYGGDFATLRDFWRPQGLGPAIILWRNGGRANSIWDLFEQLGRPLDGNGDQTFIERMGLNPDLLQLLYPRQFVSYKTHARIGIPKDARIVCFHGEPRPHEVDGWIKEYWK